MYSSYITFVSFSCSDYSIYYFVEIDLELTVGELTPLNAIILTKCYSEISRITRTAKAKHLSVITQNEGTCTLKKKG